jgi:hypothetical protein
MVKLNQFKKTNFKFSLKSQLSLNKNLKVGKLPFPKLIYASFFLSLITIILVFVFKNNLPPELPLFYGLPEGEEQLTNTFGLITPVLVALSVLLLNVFLSFFLENSFLQKTLVLSAMAISVFSSITVIKIALLVGSF